MNTNGHQERILPGGAGPLAGWLIFELRGSRGRPLPYEPPSRDTKATLEAHSGDDQVRDGNTAVGMTLLLEKFVGTAPQKLQVTRIPSTQSTTESGYEEQFNNP